MTNEEIAIVEDWIVRDRIRKGDTPCKWSAVYARLTRFAGDKIATVEEVRLYLKANGFTTTNTAGVTLINLSFQRVRPTRYKEPKNSRCEHCGRFFKSGYAQSKARAKVKD